MFKTTNGRRTRHGATLLFALPFLTAVSVAAASGQAPPTAAKLVGVVMEADSREPLSGAFIEVVPLDVRARTDRQGRYELSGLPAGKYTVVVRMIGRVVRRESIELRAGAEKVLDVALEIGVVRLPAIEVLRRLLRCCCHGPRCRLAILARSLSIRRSDRSHWSDRTPSDSTVNGSNIAMPFSNR